MKRSPVSRHLTFIYLAVNCIAQSTSGDIIPTNTWHDFFGSVYVNGQQAPIGTIVDAYDPDGVHCGTFTVTTAGIYGFMAVYGDDAFSSMDEGAIGGDIMSFRVNGYLASAGGDVTWQNSAISQVDLSSPSPCCLQRGNINHVGGIDISDLTWLVNFMFRRGPPPLCLYEANVNGIGELDIADLTYLVAYMFKSGPEPVGCP